MNKSLNNIFTLLIVFCAGLIISGCASKKKIAQAPVETVKEELKKPTWHTILVPGAEATITADKQSIRATCQMQVVRDSMLVISVMPMFGIETHRLEATPDSLFVIDKLGRQYGAVDFATINQYITPKISWNDLQEMASGEKATSETETYHWSYSAKGHTATLSLRYNTIQRNVPMRVVHLNTTRYKKIDPKTFLK